MKLARTALVAALSLAIAPAFAQTYSKTVFFGDSLTDAGFYRPFFISVAGPQAALVGKFTTNPGLVWSELLAQHYGSDGTPGWTMGAGLVIGDAPGNNFAAGGARVTLQPGVPASPPTGLAPPIQAQVTRYLAENNQQVDPDALYSFWAGGNDSFAFQSAVAANPASLPTELATLMTAAAQEAAIIKDFSSKGARYVMVLTLPNGALTPSTLAAAQAAGPVMGPAILKQAADVTAAYNNQLFAGLAGTRVIPVNTYAFLGEIAASPTVYGLSNATNGACNTTNTPIPLCSPANYVAPNAPETYLWADGSGHLTSAGHSLIAQYAVSVLEGPRLIAALPNSASMVGRSRADRVGAHLGARPDGDGMRWWADGRGDFQRYGGGDHYDGVGPSLTAGVDWTSGNLVFGGFAGYGRQKIDWGNRAGSFDQGDASLGGFVAWFGDAAWVNGQVSYSQLDFDIDRTIDLGRATRVHSGSADGSNLGFGANAGFDFGAGALRHGPVIGLLAQQIEIDGYAESDPALSTSLAYPDQSFDSLIASAGWQVRYAINDHLKPYARLTYDREFEDAPEQAFARSQSLQGSGEYAVPGLTFDQSYGTLLFGARTQMLGLDADLGTSVTVGQQGGNHATVFVTVGGSF